MTDKQAAEAFEDLRQDLAVITMLMLDFQKKFHGLKSKMADVSTSALNRKAEQQKAIDKALANRSKIRAKKRILAGA